MKKTGETRQTLLEKLQLSDNDEYWNDFVKAYEGYIYVVIRSLNIDQKTSEDLLQEVLVKVWKSFSSFKFEKGKSCFRPWLCTVIRNTVYNFLQSKANRNNQRNVDFEGGIESVQMISLPEIYKIADTEWKTFISNKAWENIRGDFSSQTIQIFEASLDEESNQLLAEKFDVNSNVIRAYKSRVRKALMKEITRLNFELGG